MYPSLDTISFGSADLLLLFEGLMRVFRRLLLIDFGAWWWEWHLCAGMLRLL
jgi:hypothetical protein